MKKISGMLARKNLKKHNIKGLIVCRQYLTATKLKPQMAVINREIKRLQKCIPSLRFP
jgi:hypothetical protein